LVGVGTRFVRVRVADGMGKRVGLCTGVGETLGSCVAIGHGVIVTVGIVGVTDGSCVTARKGVQVAVAEGPGAREGLITLVLEEVGDGGKTANA
jgi:hypothetical protein